MLSTRTLRSTASLIQRQYFHSSPFILKSSKPPSHTADSYFKDVDSNPPSDKTTHRVDSGSDAVQRPHEPPSGEWSRAGTQTNEYRNVDKDTPYGIPTDSSGADERLRYGGKSEYNSEKGPETSHPGRVQKEKKVVGESLKEDETRNQR